MRVYAIFNNQIIVSRIDNCLKKLDISVTQGLIESVDFNSIVYIDSEIIGSLNSAQAREFFVRRVMVMSMTPTIAEAKKYLSLGAMGYGNALMHESHLISSYQALDDGNMWIYPDFLSALISSIPAPVDDKMLQNLTEREREVAMMLSNGFSHIEIADELKITVRTIKAHASSIYRKLGVKDKLELSLLLRK